MPAEDVISCEQQEKSAIIRKRVLMFKERISPHKELWKTAVLVPFGHVACAELGPRACQPRCRHSNPGLRHKHSAFTPPPPLPSRSRADSTESIQETRTNAAQNFHRTSDSRFCRSQKTPECELLLPLRLLLIPQ